jgi:hypothetical protein
MLLTDVSNVESTWTIAFTLQNDMHHNWKSPNVSTAANLTIEHRKPDKRTKHPANVARITPQWRNAKDRQTAATAIATTKTGTTNALHELIAERRRFTTIGSGDAQKF